MQRREYVENRESWATEYGTYAQKLAHLASQTALVAEHIPNILDSDAAILDAGCAYGYQLRFLQTQNPRLALYGVEIARHAAQEAAAALHLPMLSDESSPTNSHGAIFHQSIHTPVPLPPDSLDAILCFDVIEHIADAAVLDAMVREWARLLKPTGLLFLETPNYNRRMQWLHKLTGQGHMLKYDHVNLFDEFHLRALLAPAFQIHGVRYRGTFDPRLPLVRGIASPSLYLSAHLCAVARPLSSR